MTLNRLVVSSVSQKDGLFYFLSLTFCLSSASLDIFDNMLPTLLIQSRFLTLFCKGEICLKVKHWGFNGVVFQ